MKIVVIVGIPGVGKSAILKEVLKHAPHAAVVNYGDKMLEEASLQGISRDAMRKMAIADQQQIGLRTAQKIVQHPEKKVVIVDTHALVKTPFGYCPGLPRAVLEILFPYAFAWVTCAPEKILARRAADPSRHRDADTLEALTQHQELTGSFLAASCMYTNALLCCLSNDGPDLAQNALPLVQLIS